LRYYFEIELLVVRKLRIFHLGRLGLQGCLLSFRFGNNGRKQSNTLHWRLVA
jgi:hypothetical protein